MIPRWLTWLTFARAVTLFFAAGPAFFKSGPFAYHGLLAFYLPVAIWATYLALTTWYMLKELKRTPDQPQIPQPAPPPHRTAPSRAGLLVASRTSHRRSGSPADVSAPARTGLVADEHLFRSEGMRVDPFGGRLHGPAVTGLDEVADHELTVDRSADHLAYRWLSARRCTGPDDQAGTLAISAASGAIAPMIS
jgi:hypothetical protein